MRIVLLCRNGALHGVRRITEAARARRHTVRVLNPYAFLLKLRGGRLSLEHGGKPFRHADALLPRLGAAISEHSLSLIRHLEAAGHLVINPPAAIDIARDKLRTLQLLSGHGVPVPRSAFSPNPEFLSAALRSVGGPPAVFKFLHSTQGMGVMLAESREAAQAIADAMWAARQNALIQEYLRGARRQDFRLFVVGGEVVAAVRRRAPRGDFRSNLHRGGRARAVRPGKEAVSLALRSAALCGLDIAGIDLLETEQGFRVLEVNAAPGFEGLEEATRIDVAARVVGLVEERVRLARGKGRSRLAPAPPGGV